MKQLLIILLLSMLEIKLHATVDFSARLNQLIQSNQAAVFGGQIIDKNTITSFIKTAFLSEKKAIQIFKSATSYSVYEWKLDQWANLHLDRGLHEFIATKLIISEINRNARFSHFDIRTFFSKMHADIETALNAHIASTLKAFANNVNQSISDELKSKYGEFLKSHSYPHKKNATTLEVYENWTRHQKNLITYTIEKNYIKNYIARQANSFDPELSIKTNLYKNFVKTQRQKAKQIFESQTMTPSEVALKLKLDPAMALVIKEVKVLNLKSSDIEGLKQAAPKWLENEISQTLLKMQDVFNLEKLDRYLKYEQLAEQLTIKYRGNLEEIKQQKGLNEQMYLDSGDFKYFMVARILELAAFLAENASIDLSKERMNLKQVFTAQFLDVIKNLENLDKLTQEEKKLRFLDLFINRIKRLGEGQSIYASKFYQMIVHAAAFELKQILGDKAGKVQLIQYPKDDKKMKKAIVEYLKTQLMEQRIQKYFAAVIKKQINYEELKITLNGDKMLEGDQAYQFIMAASKQWWHQTSYDQ